MGNVMMDALEYNMTIVEDSSTIFDVMDFRSKDIMVATIHRHTYTDNKNILSMEKAFCNAADQTIVFTHLSTERYMKEYNSWYELCHHVIAILRVGYLDILKLTANSKILIILGRKLYAESAMCNPAGEY
jgi:UDP-N-acetylglucosamine 2-epimerase